MTAKYSLWCAEFWFLQLSCVSPSPKKKTTVQQTAQAAYVRLPKSPLGTGQRETKNDFQHKAAVNDTAYYLNTFFLFHINALCKQISEISLTTKHGK